MKQVEDMRQELQSSWRASSDAEARAAVAEVRSNKLFTKVLSALPGCFNLYVL